MGNVLLVALEDTNDKIFDDLIRFLNSEHHNIKVIREISDRNYLEYRDLIIDSKCRNIRVKGEPVRLTTTEYEILYLLASHPGWVFTYQQIYEAVWNEEYACEKGSIMSHIQRIRKKIKADSQSHQYIENIRGIGYRFNG